MQRFFRDNHGNGVAPISLAVPIITKTQEGMYKFVATGFLVHYGGGFVTANHVMYDNNGKLLSPCYVVQTVDGIHHFVREVQVFFPHPVADIGIGMLRGDLMKDGKKLFPIPMTVSLKPVNIGDNIRTFAYHKSDILYSEKGQIGNFKGEWQEGKVIEHFPRGRGINFPSESFQTSILVPSGASGGPVLRNSVVVGVNSTGYNLPEGEEPISFITPISELFDLEIQDSDGGKFLVRDLIKNGSIPSVN